MSAGCFLITLRRGQVIIQILFSFSHKGLSEKAKDVLHLRVLGAPVLLVKMQTLLFGYLPTNMGNVHTYQLQKREHRY